MGFTFNQFFGAAAIGTAIVGGAIATGVSSGFLSSPPATTAPQPTQNVAASIGAGSSVAANPGASTVVPGTGVSVGTGSSVAANPGASTVVPGTGVSVGTGSSVAANPGTSVGTGSNAPVVSSGCGAVATPAPVATAAPRPIPAGAIGGWGEAPPQAQIGQVVTTSGQGTSNACASAPALPPDDAPPFENGATASL